MKKRDKSGQMEMSFGMIFTIISVIIFIAFAVYAISIFLNSQKSIQAESFANELQNDIDKMWQGSGQQEKTYSVPGKIEYVCFINFNSPADNMEEIYSKLKLFSDEGNLFFYPHDYEGKEIQHIDLQKTTVQKNPLCIQNNNGVKITIKKDFGDALITVSG